MRFKQKSVEECFGHVVLREEMGQTAGVALNHGDEA